MKLWRVAAGIIWHGERCLMARRPDHWLMGGYYEFPGGKIEPGETSYNAVIRELCEELSITPLRPEYWRTLEYGEREARGDGAVADMSAPDAWRVNIDFFHVVEYTGVLKANEGQEWLFVLPDEAAKLRLLPANLPIVEALRRLRHLP